MLPLQYRSTFFKGSIDFNESGVPDSQLYCKNNEYGALEVWTTVRVFYGIINGWTIISTRANIIDNVLKVLANLHIFNNTPEQITLLNICQTKSLIIKHHDTKKIISFNTRIHPSFGASRLLVLSGGIVKG